MSEAAQNPELEYQARQVLLEAAEKLAIDPGWMAKLDAEAWMGNPTARIINRRIRLAAHVIFHDYKSPQLKSPMELVDFLVEENIAQGELESSRQDSAIIFFTK